MKFNYLTAALATVLWLGLGTAWAAPQCDQTAIFSCKAEYHTAAGNTFSPEVSSHFQISNDGEGETFCAAYTSLKIPNTDIELDASVSDAGSKGWTYDLFTLQGNVMSNTGFSSQKNNEVSAEIDPSGSSATLLAITYTCSLH